MRIDVLVLDGVFDTGLTSVLDTFTTANELAESTGLTTERFNINVVAVRRRVRTLQGLLVPATTPGRIRPDVAIVPALGTKMPGPLEEALMRKDVFDAGDLIHGWANRGAMIGAACTSTFVLAETSLLDRRRATTTWWLAPMFRTRYPLVELDESRMLVESLPVVTAGAALGHLDLALSVVRRRSPALASMVARYLVVEPRPSQAAFIIPDHLAHSDPIVERFERWARENLADGFSLGVAARAVGTSERTLARRLRSVLDKTPLSYFQDLRVERAMHLLQTGNASIDQIAARVGYADGVTLRTLLKRKLGRTLRDVRRRDEES